MGLSIKIRMLTKALLYPIPNFRASSAGSAGGASNLYQRWISKQGLGLLSGKASALTLSAFYNGVNIIANDYAKLPKGIYKKSKDGKGREEVQHELKYLINTRPNNFMTAFDFDRVMIIDTIIKGNGIAVKEIDNRTGALLALHYVDQRESSVYIFKRDGKLWYKIDGRLYTSEDVIHISGFSYNGIYGVGVITHAARSLGVYIKSEQFADDYYENKGVGTGILTTSKQMKPDAKIALGEAVSNMFLTKSRWTVPVIDEAANFEHLKITPQEAEFLTSQEHGVSEVARWLNINPSKLKNNKDINNSISESLERQHVNDSILPYAIKAQQEYSYKLLTDAEKKAGYYIKCNTKSLLTADMSAQADYFSKMLFAGVYTRNEVRAYLEKNPLTGLDEPLTPVNTEIWDVIQAKLKQLEKNEN